MAVTISGGTSQNGSVANFEFSTTGFDDGDLIIMGVSVAGDVSGSIAPDEAGWTSQIAQVYETGSEGTLYIWSRVLSGSPPATYGVTWTGSVNAAGFAVALAGQDTTTPIDFTSTYNEGNSTSPVNTAGTTTVDNVFLLEVLGLNRNDRVTPPTGTTPTWTEQVDRGNGTVGGGTSIAVYTGTLASAGGTGTHTIGGVGSAAAWGVALIGVRPASAPTQNIGAQKITVTPSFHNPTVVPGSVTIAAQRITPSVTFHNPTIIGPQYIGAQALTITPTFHNPAVYQVVAAQAITVTPTFHSPAVYQVVQPPVLSVTPTFHNPTVVPGSVSIGQQLLTVTPTFHSPSVAVGVGMQLITVTPTFHSPIVIGPGAHTISITVQIGLQEAITAQIGLQEAITAQITTQEAITAQIGLQEAITTQITKQVDLTATI